MARVLFDARPASTCTTGIGRYARSMAEHVSALRGHQGSVLGGPSGLALGARSPEDEELRLPALLERESIDVFHSPLFHLPAILPCRSVVTVHDAIPAVLPDLTSEGFKALFAEAAPAAARADRVVCPSESARRDLVERLGLDAARIRVVPEAPAPIFRELEEGDADGREFLLVVGSIEPRKNPTLVLDALALMADFERPLVVFVGPEAGFDLAGAARKRGVAVEHRGVVEDEELVCLYNDARALVFPSLYEGFGLPIVEAFACGTPVIATNVASIPEVAGDAARLVDPRDPRDLAEAIRDVLWFADLRDELRAKGRERLDHYSPDRVQAALAQLYEELAP